MIGSMRENLKHLKWVIWAVIAAFVVTIFAVWGGGMRRSEGIAADWVAKIGDREKITVIEFFGTYRISEMNFREVYRGQEGQFDPAAMNLGYMIVDNMIDERLLGLEAEKVGFRVTDDELAETIINDPSFQREGRFIGSEEYAQILSVYGMSPAIWENQIRWRLMAQKMTNLLSALVVPTEKAIEERFHDTLRRANLLYFFVPENFLPKEISVSESAMTEYYNAHKDDFKLPEERAIQYVLFYPRDWYDKIKITEEELRDYYDRAREYYYVSDERWHASHILVKTDGQMSDEEKNKKSEFAKNLAERAKKGEDFAKLAKTHSEDPGSAVKGGDLGYFTKGRMVKPFEDAVVNTKKGEITGPVETSFGYHIIKVHDYDPGGYYQKFEDVRDNIRKEFVSQRASTAAYETARELSQLAAPTEFKGYAEKLGYDVRESPFFTRTAEDLFEGHLSVIQQRAFFLNVHEVSAPIILADGGYCVLYIAERREGRIPPFSEVRGRVRETLVNAQKEKTYLESAEKYLKDLRAKKIRLGELASRFNKIAEHSGTFTRTNSPVKMEGKKTPGLFEQIESAHEGYFGSYYLPGAGGGLMIYEVESKISFEKDALEGKRDILRDEIVKMRLNEVRSSVLANLRNRYKIALNTEIIEAAQKGGARMPGGM